jgi:predicted GH43/DUF377 family glycosyl hydrolase
MKITTKLLLTTHDIVPTKRNFRVRGVFNPAGVRLQDKRILLYARVAETPKHDEKTFLAPRFVGKRKLEIYTERLDRKQMEISPDYSLTNRDVYRLPTISHFRNIMLDSKGEKILHIGEKPDFYGVKDDGDFGVEDPRITYFRNERKYALTYVSISKDSGISTSLATAEKCGKWKRRGIIFRQQNKDVVIFPEKFRGHYVALHRPEGTMIFDKPSIWISYSKDLIFWGNDRPLIKPRKAGWDSSRIGMGTVPVKTDEGWLGIYHGVSDNKQGRKSGKFYRAGAILFDLKNPGKVCGRTHAGKPLFEPELKSEKKGFNNNTVFPTAALLSVNRKHLLVYSGGADSVITMRKIRLKDILNSLE